MKKRILSLVLTLTMLASMCAFAPISVSAETYSPIATIDWNGHTYHVYDESMTWEEAKQYCENSGGHLATITSEEENTIISNLISNSNYTKSMYWLGGYKDGDWKWITDESFVYANWNYGEPTNTQKCIVMYTALAKSNVHNQAKHGMWLDNPNNGIGSWSVSKTGFICEFGDVITPPNRIELSSNRSSMSVIEGETFNVLATIYDNNNDSVSPTGITFSVENKSVAEVVDSNFSGNNAIAVIKANTAGTTTLKVSDANKNVVVTAPITVLRSHNNTYTIYSVPHRTTNYSWALVNDTYNFYNFSGLYVDNFIIKTVRADGSCSIAFDAYNENYTYGIVEVYDSNGEIKDAVVIDKYKPDNTSIKEALWDNGGSIVQLVNPFDNQTWQSYKNSAFSEETRVTLDNVPKGGYIRITPSSRESLLLCILNEIDIVLSTQDAIEKIAGFGESTNVELFQNIANSMVKKDTIYKPIKEHMKDFAVGSSKNFLKGIGKDFVINANSIGTFVETLKNNLSTIDWQNMVEDACVDTAVSITEKVFKGVAGMAGVGLNACFAIGSTGNLICECNDFVDLIDAPSIYIQNPEDSRTFKGVTVETVIPINNNVSLETYRIESTEIESYFEKNTFSNRNFTEEFLTKQGLYKKPIVEYINISMINNGKETQLNCKATVSVPVPESMKALQWDDTPWDNDPLEEKSLKVNVYRVETDGTLTKMNNVNIVLRKDDYYVQFETDHFSIYAIVAENNSDTGGQTSKSDIDDMFSGISDWARAEIEEAVEKKLIPSALVFTDLRENINRKEFAALAVELYESITGKDAEYGNVPFKDISQYDTEIKKAYSLGITTGTSETRFEPNTLISREQLATMLCRVFKKYAWDGWSIENDNKYSLNYSGVNKFADDDEISGYARPSVYFMAKHNIINGVGNNKFAPKSTNTVAAFATREQAILMALRCYNNLFNDEVISDSQIDTSSVDYEKIYLDYAKEIDNGKKSESGFTLIEKNNYSGIILADLNDDSIPEMLAFSTSMKDGEIDHVTLERAFYIENNTVVEHTPWRTEYVNPETGLMSYGFDDCFMNNLPGNGTDRETFEAVLKNGTDGNNIFGIYYLDVRTDGKTYYNVYPNFYTIDYVAGEGMKYTSSEFTADIYDSYEITDVPLIYELCNNRSCVDLLKAALGKYKSEL